MKKYISLLFGSIAILFFGACSVDKKEAPKEKFLVIKPLITDTSYQSEYVAEIHARQHVEIRTRVRAFIEKIYVDEGQAVQQSQALFALSSAGYLQELHKASSMLQSALAEQKSVQIEVDNMKGLSNKNIVAASELKMQEARLEAVQARVAEARAEKEKADLHLSFTKIGAPFDGTINRIHYKTGSLLEEGSLLTTISNNKEVFAYFKVSEADYLNYRAAPSGAWSNNVSLRLANNSLYEHKGVIETTESEFDPGTGNIAFRAKFPNPDQLLKHGSSAKVLINTYLKNVMLIPQKSTLEIQGNLFVFAVDKTGKVQMRKVIASLRLPHLYVISAGLKRDEQIIYEGIQQIKEGDQVLSQLVDFPRNL